MGLDAYSILIRGTEVDTHSDYEKTLTEVVRHAHLQALRKLNESHAKTMIGGKVAIIREYEDPNFQIPTYAIMAPPQFSEWYRGNTAYKLVENKPKLTNLGKDWLEWSGQRRYNAMTFKPALMDDTVYNAWTGFPVKSVDGDWGLMKELMLEGLCDGNHVYYEWLMDWMAVGLQAPTERYGVATVLRGEKGIGKGQFAKWYGRLFGNHFLHLSNARHLLGNFNAHFERALLVFADELIWGGNKQEEGVLKSFVTEELIPIEHKGYDVEMRPNYARLLVASNEEWAVPAGTHERRWFVLDVSSKYRQNTDFFGALTTQMQSGGLEAMMFELINRKTTTNQRKPPKTKALAAVAVMGLDDVASWLYDALSAGELYDSERFRSRAHLLIRTAEDYEALRSAQARVDRCPVSDPLEIGFKPIWPYGVDKDALYKSYEAHCRQRNRYGRAKDRGAFYKRLKTLLPSAKEERPRFNGIQVKIVLWPLLMQAREEFNRHSGLDFEYEQEYEDAA
jgi:hypothetical protein